MVVELAGSQVKSAHFQATEMRGFQHLLQGVPAEQMPVVAPRICGVCSTAHHVAAVKALENAWGVEPPPVAKRVRELLMLGQLIQNQATSVFIFTMPDRLGVSSMLQLAADDLGTDRERAQLATQALKVRKAGTDLITGGRRAVHSSRQGGGWRGVERDVPRRGGFDPPRDSVRSAPRVRDAGQVLAAHARDGRPPFDLGRTMLPPGTLRRWGPSGQNSAGIC